MNPDAQQIAIAEICGWHIVSCHVGKAIPPNLIAYERGPSEVVMASELPKYTEDLNAMNEAEEIILPKGRVTESGTRYYHELAKLSDPAWHATAAQRAEAFLRTLGKWKDFMNPQPDNPTPLSEDDAARLRFIERLHGYEDADLAYVLRIQPTGELLELKRVATNEQWFEMAVKLAKEIKSRTPSVVSPGNKAEVTEADEKLAAAIFDEAYHYINVDRYLTCVRYLVAEHRMTAVKAAMASNQNFSQREHAEVIAQRDQLEFKLRQLKSELARVVGNLEQVSLSHNHLHEQLTAERAAHEKTKAELTIARVFQTEAEAKLRNELTAEQLVHSETLRTLETARVHWQRDRFSLTDERTAHAATKAKMKAELAETNSYLTQQDVRASEAEAANMRLVEVLRIIAAPKRSDGTYNRCREACEKLASDAIAQHTAFSTVKGEKAL